MPRHLKHRIAEPGAKKARTSSAAPCLGDTVGLPVVPRVLILCWRCPLRADRVVAPQRLAPAR